MRWIDPQCRDRPELFFPIKHETPLVREARQDAAMELCRACPDREQCVELGIREEVTEIPDPRYAPGGVWGGYRRRELLRVARALGHDIPPQP